jgi:hypothetical protein
MHLFTNPSRETGITHIAEVDIMNTCMMVEVFIAEKYLETEYLETEREDNKLECEVSPPVPLTNIYSQEVK